MQSNFFCKALRVPNINFPAFSSIPHGVTADLITHNFFGLFIFHHAKRVRFSKRLERAIFQCLKKFILYHIHFFFAGWLLRELDIGLQGGGITSFFPRVFMLTC